MAKVETFLLQENIQDIKKSEGAWIMGGMTRDISHYLNSFLLLGNTFLRLKLAHRIFQVIEFTEPSNKGKLVRSLRYVERSKEHLKKQYFENKKLFYGLYPMEAKLFEYVFNDIESLM